MSSVELFGKYNEHVWLLLHALEHAPPQGNYCSEFNINDFDFLIKKI